MTTQSIEQEQKEREWLYKPSSRKVEIVDVPTINFLMVDGVGDPNASQSYHEAIEALYALSYTIKFALKQSAGLNYRVALLEGLWWGDDMSVFMLETKEAWQWTMMIAQPSMVTQAMVDQASATVKGKKNPAALSLVHFDAFSEGRAAQIMHIGPYAAEAPTIQKLHDFIHTEGGGFDGSVQKHHEIYLGDPRRAAPEKLKTVIRQPFVCG